MKNMMIPHIGLANNFIVQSCNDPIGRSMWTRQLGKHNLTERPESLNQSRPAKHMPPPFTHLFLPTLDELEQNITRIEPNYTSLSRSTHVASTWNLLLTFHLCERSPGRDIFEEVKRGMFLHTKRGALQFAFKFGLLGLF